VKRKLLSATLPFAFVALIFAGFAPAQVQRAGVKAVTGSTPSGTGALITVLNPAVANKMVDRLPLAPRPNSLEGKTIYMVDINWGGPEAAYSVFEEMQAWFAKNMPTVKTEIRRKKGSYATDDPALWKEMGDKKVDAAIVGISG
jgi:hypothetical protein